MNIRQIALLPTIFLGAALGGAALAGAVANAEPSNPPFTPNELSSWPMPVGAQYGTDYDTTWTSETLPSIPYIYSGSQTTTNYQLFGSDGDVTGAFDVTGTRYQYGIFPPFPFAYVTNSNVVSDSEGTGLPDGTTWDSTSFRVAAFASVELFGTQSISVPDGMTVDWVNFFGVANEVVTTSDGITDYLYVFGPDPILLFDIPT